MQEQEGVIKYQLNHKSIPISQNITISEMNAWRTIFYNLKLIGQVDERYDGYGFGNISQRIKLSDTEKNKFIISGTQTGHIQTLSKDDYCLVENASTEKNSLQSSGLSKPSSEALTHASVYQLNNSIQFIIHVHCQEIWQNSVDLGLPCTLSNVPYGTPEMAQEVKRLFNSTSLQNTAIFSMLGHEDGVISYSDSIENAACSLISLYSKALILNKAK